MVCHLRVLMVRRLPEETESIKDLLQLDRANICTKTHTDASPPGRNNPIRVGPIHGEHHGGGDTDHLPPGGPRNPLPDPDQRARGTRYPCGLQTGPEQTQREILLQVRGRRLRVSYRVY